VRSEGCAPSRTTHTIEGASVEVEDTSRPGLGSEKRGTVETATVQSGLATLAFSSTDNVGVRSARLLVDGVEKARRDLACDYSRAVPCPTAVDETLGFDSTTLPDGSHVAQLVVRDAAGNESTYDKAIQVSNGPGSPRPGGETGPSVGGAPSAEGGPATAPTLSQSVSTPSLPAGLSAGAVVTLSTDKRSLKNGQALAFAGSLRADERPFPGVIVALQAKVGRRWVTFKNTRTTATGTFNARYRFRRTTVTRRYAFRARVSQQQGFTLDRNSSVRTVRVRAR